MPFLASVSARQGGVVFANAVKPGYVTSSSGTRGDTSAALSWNEPTNGGSPITDYVIQFSSDSGSTWTTFADTVSTATSVTVTGLTNGTTYMFRIAAKNNVGTGDYSASLGPITPAGLPGSTGTPVASLPATYGNTTAALTWTAASANGSAITDYIVQYSSNSGSSWTTFADGTSTTTSTTVTGLTNGTAYVFRVYAVNAVGSSAIVANSNSVTPLFGKIATPVVSDIAETTSMIPLYYDNYASQSQADGYVYNYYDYNFVPNDQSGSIHGWTGLAENVTRFTYVYLSKTGWANSDSIYLTESTNSTPATTAAPVTTEATTTAPVTTEATTTAPVTTEAPLPGCSCQVGQVATDYRCIYPPAGATQQQRNGIYYNGSCGTGDTSGINCTATACSECNAVPFYDWGSWYNISSPGGGCF